MTAKKILFPCCKNCDNCVEDAPDDNYVLWCDLHNCGVDVENRCDNYDALN